MKYILLGSRSQEDRQRARILRLAEIWLLFATALKVISLLGVCANRKPGKQTPERGTLILKASAAKINGAEGFVNWGFREKCS